MQFKGFLGLMLRVFHKYENNMQSKKQQRIFLIEVPKFKISVQLVASCNFRRGVFALKKNIIKLYSCRISMHVKKFNLHKNIRCKIFLKFENYKIS